MSDKTDLTLRRVMKAYVDATPLAPRLEPDDQPPTSRIWMRRPIVVTAISFVVVLVSIGIAGLTLGSTDGAPADGASPVGTLTAACEPTETGDASGMVQDTPWSVTVSGTPPFVSIMASANGELIGGMEDDASSWGNYVHNGVWEWVYLAHDVKILFGKVPLDASAQATLTSGEAIPLCSVGTGLDYGIGYVAGAFPSSVEIQSVEILGPDGTVLGSAALAEIVDFVLSMSSEIPVDQGNASTGFSITIPIDN